MGLDLLGVNFFRVNVKCTKSLYLWSKYKNSFYANRDIKSPESAAIDAGIGKVGELATAQVLENLGITSASPDFSAWQKANMPSKPWDDIAVRGLLSITKDGQKINIDNEDIAVKSQSVSSKRRLESQISSAHPRYGQDMHSWTFQYNGGSKGCDPLLISPVPRKIIALTIVNDVLPMPSKRGVRRLDDFNLITAFPCAVAFFSWLDLLPILSDPIADRLAIKKKCLYLADIKSNDIKQVNLC